MTVGTAAPRVEYVENGVTLVHNVTFPFFDGAELVVSRILVDGTEHALALDVDYTVTGGHGLVGAIAKAAGGTDGATIRIDRHTKRSQEMDYAQGDDFPAESHEEALDRGVMIDQEQDLRILSAEQIVALIAGSIVGVGISAAYDPTTNKITLTNLYNAEFIRDTIGAALVAGAGIELTVDDALNLIRIAATDPAHFPDCVELSGDMQTGDGIGGGAQLTGEQIADLVAALLEGGTGISVVYDDAGDVITITNTAPATSDYDDADAIAAVAVALAAGPKITINVAGDVITIGCTALAASYRGLAVITKAGAFSFDDDHGGCSILYTGGAASATLAPDSVEALSDGWGTVIRNKGTGTLTLALGAGVELFVNGATVSSVASLAQGAVATINRWAEDEFTIVGPKVNAG